jgi:divalent anion:Na+ symporter, DASS family
MTMTVKKWIFLAVALAAGVTIAFIPPPSGLDDQSMRVLAVLTAAIVLWAGEVFHEAVTALLMATMFVVVGGLEITTAYASFSQPTVWLLIAAFGLGAAIKECGLLHRVSLLLLKLFPKSYRGQVIGLMTVTTLTAPFVPSKAAKATVLSPLTRGVSDVMGYPENSKPATGLFNAFYAPTCASASLFISASVTTFALVGMYSPEVQAEYGMVRWALSALPWFLPLFLMCFLFIAWYYRPKEKVELDSQFLQSKITELGPWTSKEKLMGAIMLVTVLLWVTKDLTGVPEWATTVLALCATIAFGVLPVNKWRTNVAWESLIFIACAISLATVLPAVGVSDWLVSVISPYTENLFGNPFLLILGLAATMIIGRFLILSETAALAVFTAFFFPLAISAGINPWVVGFLLNVFVIVYFLPYQSSVFLSATYAGGEGWVSPKVTSKFCFIYCTFALVSCFIGYFIWDHVLGIWYL